jgi:chemotaxis protein MotB
MGQQKKQPPAEESPGAPLWMVTFSDCMNLLLTFFVLLTTFSSYDTNVLSDMGSSFRQIFSVGIGMQPNTSMNSLQDKTLVVPVEAHDKGSETPTLLPGSQNNLKQEAESSELHNGKTFLIPSINIFLGKGLALSSTGKDLLSNMASFLQEVPTRVIISETGQENSDNEQLGFQRSMAVIEYLTKNHKIDKKLLSVSLTNFIPREDFENSRTTNLKSEFERTLEIVLLERSLYN